MDKADVRRTIKALKRELTAEEKQHRSERIIAQIEALPEYQQAQTVLLYWSMDDEVQTHSLVERAYTHKTILLPSVDGNNLRLKQYTGLDCLVAGQQFGIGEPTGPDYTRLDNIDLIIVPGVAFDRKGNRMGRGRGFYDRLLATTPNAIKIGIAYNFQLLDTIPTEPFDIPMNLVITD